MVNVFKGNEIIKGITFGLLSLSVLEFGSIVVLAALNNFNIWYYNYVFYYSLLAFNAIIAVLLGISIVKKLSNIKRIAYILNICVFILLVAGYIYFVLYRFSHDI